MANYNEAPIVIAGDICDRPKLSPEVVNRLISHLRRAKHGVFGIPGQHDLPFHRYEDIKKSSYWTLVESGVIENLNPEFPMMVKELMLHSFPWGTELKPLPKRMRGVKGKPLHLAVVHHYVWSAGHSYPGVKDEDHVNEMEKRLAGYDGIVFGDNHSGFHRKRILNCGTLIRRRADEINHRPAVGILYSNGTIERVKLDTSKDEWAEVGEELVTGTLNAESFLETLGELGEISLDFAESVRRFLNKSKAGPLVRKFILEALT